MTLINVWMPDAEIATRHAVTIAAEPHRVWAALVQVDVRSHPLVALLMAVRALPALVVSPRRTWRRLRRPRSRGPLGTPLGNDFVLLEERQEEEIVLGLTGRFWSASGGLVETDPASFRDEVPAGSARAAWCFRLEPVAEGTRLVTETRVRCADAATLRKFLRYWTLVAPGSGLIRRAILAAVRERAESPRDGESPPRPTPHT